MSAAARSHDEGGRDWEIVTPEGVPLVFTLARAGDRAAAFLIDFVLLALGVIAILLLARLAGSPGGDWTTAFALLVSFLMRNFYFTWFELRWHGATPGKRKIGIRVIDGDGGQLSADAVFARNFMREPPNRARRPGRRRDRSVRNLRRSRAGRDGSRNRCF